MVVTGFTMHLLGFRCTRQTQFRACVISPWPEDTFSHFEICHMCTYGCHGAPRTGRGVARVRININYYVHMCYVAGVKLNTAPVAGAIGSSPHRRHQGRGGADRAGTSWGVQWALGGHGGLLAAGPDTG